MQVLCECGNNTFYIIYTDGPQAVCTSCEKQERISQQPFTIRMP
jgi:hypothetical protein